MQKIRFWFFMTVLMILTGVLAGMLAGCTRGKKELIDDDTLLLGFSQLGSESGWRLGNTKSIENAAEAAGIRLMMDNANQSQKNQITTLRSFIAYRVDVIAFSPIVEDGWDNVLVEAAQAGIPVIIEDRFINTANDSLYACQIGSDFYSEGVKAGEYLLKKLSTMPEGTTLNVVELAGTLDSSPAIRRAAGFRDTVAKEPRIHILDSMNGDFLITKGRECIRALLDKYGTDIDVLYSHNDGMMYGALEAIEEYGLAPGKDVIIISVDGEQRAIDLLKEGKVNCVVECTPMLGDIIMQTAKDLKAGKEVQKEVYSEEMVFTEFDDLSKIGPRGY